MSALTELSPGQRRQATVVVLVGLLLVALLALVLPLWLIGQRYGEALADRGARLERYQRQAAARPALERKLEAVRAQGGQRFFLKAAAGSLAAAEVQDRVRQVIDSNGARVVSVQVGQPKEDGRFRQVSVTVQMNATVGSLRRALVALEASEPYLIIDSLVVRSQVPPGFRPAPGFDPEVFVQIDVSAYAVSG